MSDNIKVVVKVRPLISREIEDKLCHQWRVKENTLHQIDFSGKDIGTSYTFDKVYDESAKSSSIYRDIAKPIVEAAIEGINGTIFAYGQTSSGKTYTMTGTSEEPGIIQMAVQDLFDIIDHRKDRDFLVRASYIEIYNESVNDLLNTNKCNMNVKLHNGSYGCKIDATERVTTTPKEVLDLMIEGEQNRHIGSTNMNERSSRSHTIFQITIESREHAEGEEEEEEGVGCVNVSQLNLVDLAGSERAHQTAADNVRFKEGTSINLSLTQLGLVIKQLSDVPRPKFINYRDSKLTRLLQNSLGGNAKTSIICAVTPAALEETTSTLQFANRAKSIKNKPEVNAVATAAANDTMIQKLTKKLSLLQSELVNKKTVEADNQVLLKKIKKLQCQILNGICQKSVSDASHSRRKTWCAPRRQTLHAIPEDGTTENIQRFCTPALKYNPLTFLDSASSKERLKSDIESNRGTTPVFDREKRVNFEQQDVITLDSDDDNEYNNKENSEECSPMHNKCYDQTKTPPCVLRKRVKLYEQEYNEIVEMTGLEKIYSPEINELTEKLSDCTLKISSLEDVCEEKDNKIKELNEMLYKSSIEMKEVLKLKDDLELKCKEFHTKLTDIEVSYETLKRKKDLREQELLSMLEDKKETSARDTGKEGNKETSNLLEFEFSLVGSDNESTANCNDDNSLQIHSIVSDIQTQLSNKNIVQLENDAEIQKLKSKIEFITNTNLKLEEQIASVVENKELEVKVKILEETISTLNATIENLKQDLDSANSDIKSYNDVIHELRLNLSKKDNIPNLDERDIELLIANEETFLANNENLNNIILTLKNIINSKNQEIDYMKIRREKEKSLKSGEYEQKCKQLTQEIQQLTKNIQNSGEEINTLNTENVKLVNRISELEEICANLKETIKTCGERVCSLEKQDTELNSKLNKVEEQNTSLAETKKQLVNEIQSMEEENSKLQVFFSQIKGKNEELVKENLDLKTEICKIQEKYDNVIEDFKNNKDEEISNSEKDLLHQIYVLTNKVKALENDLQQQQNIIVNLNQDKQIDVCMSKIKLVGNRIQNLLLTLVGSNHEIIPDDVLDSDIILQCLMDFVNSLEFAITEIVAEKDNILDEKNTLSKELGSNKLQLFQIQDLISKYEKEIERTSNENLSLKEHRQTENMKVTQLQQKLNETITLNKELQDNLINKDKTLESLLSNESDLNGVIENLKDMLINREEELQMNILTLQDAHKSKMTILEKVVADKNSEIANLNDMILQLQIQFKESEEITQKENSKAKIEMERKLEDANIEISRLVVENLNLLQKSTKLNSNLQKVSTEVSRMGQGNKNTIFYLKECNILIENLQKGLQDKVKEFDILENNTKMYKDEITNSIKAMETTIHELQTENALLKSECNQQVRKSSSDNTSVSALDCFSSKEYLQTENRSNVSSPPSLINICCNKISDVFISSKSTNNTVQDDIYLIRQNDDTELNDLKLKIAFLQSENRDLFLELEKVREEVQLLIGPVQELEKKALIHRTHLSTLTATTYAESKLLSSQVKVLHYLNKKLMNIYDKDLPALKRQLHTLLAILRTNPAKLSPNIKRFSLPDALDENVSYSILASDSTLDGDLLMLDNYITLSDSILDGYDQTYFDDNKLCLTEIDKEVSEIADSIPNLVKGHMQALDNQMNELKQENEDLKEQIKKYSSNDHNSPCYVQIDGKVSCKNCLDKQLIIQTLELITEQKVKLEVMIEQMQSATSPNNLDSTLKSLETKYAVKSEENKKNFETINKKNQEIKLLQQENESLSNDLMDRIQEIEDLNKQYEKVVTINSELENTIADLKSKSTLNNSNCCGTCSANDEHVKGFNTDYSRTPCKSQSKFQSLQHELDASREDCKKITEEVATIRNHLERSNISLTNKIDPDVSIGESNIFHITKILQSPQSIRQNVVVTGIENKMSNTYNMEKMECLNFFIDKTGIEKENLNQDLNIYDTMKMLYNTLVAKHGQEVENLHNELRNIETSKMELNGQINSLKIHNTEVQKQLQKSINHISNVNDTITKFKECLLNINPDDDITKVAKDFKDNCLLILDNQFSTNSKHIFESLLNNFTEKYECDISSVKKQYHESLHNIETLNTELKCATDKLQDMTVKFIGKEEEFNLLQKQKIKVHEISNAVTLNIIKKEKELCGVITDGLKKLFKYNIIPPENIDTPNVIPQNVTEIFDRLINHIQVNARSIETEKEELMLHIKKSETLLLEKENELKMLKEENSNLIQMDGEVKQLELKEIEHMKQVIADKQQIIDSLQNKQLILETKSSEAANLASNIEQLQYELAQLQVVNKTITEENKYNTKELNKCEEIINSNKKQMEDMKIEIRRLKECVLEKQNIIEKLQSEGISSINIQQNSLTQKLSELEKIYEEKCKEHDVLSKSNKTHENTVRVQINIIKRLRTENETTKSTLQEKEQVVEDLMNQCKTLQEKCNVMEKELEQSKETINNLNEEINNLEPRGIDIEKQLSSHKSRPSLDNIGDKSRRRRQSFYDSRRMFEDGDFDTSKAEAVFASRGKPDDLFVDTEDTNSSRSTPTLMNKRDSLLGNRSGERDGGSPVPGNAAATRLRRQSFHDQNRTLPTSSPRESINPVLQEGAGDLSEISRLRTQLALCQQELNELKEKYRELDEECETCSQYLQERDNLCAELNKEKRQLEKTVQELQQKIDGYNSHKKISSIDVSVNTDEDWSNLHSIVVDRMSFDVEVEKNKKLTKTVEELRYKNYELKNTIAKMQRALEKYSNRDQTGLQQEVTSLKEEVNKYKELMSEMGSSRQKRQSVHDHNRLQPSDMVDAYTAICDDLLSTQVERDQTLKIEEYLREIRRLKKNVEELSRQKSELEGLLATQSVNVATGSGIVKDQQLSDALKENHKLKKINAKLLEICKKRKDKHQEHKENNPELQKQ